MRSNQREVANLDQLERERDGTRGRKVRDKREEKINNSCNNMTQMWRVRMKVNLCGGGHGNTTVAELLARLLTSRPVNKRWENFWTEKVNQSHRMWRMMSLSCRSYRMFTTNRNNKVSTHQKKHKNIKRTETLTKNKDHHPWRPTLTLRESGGGQGC